MTHTSKTILFFGTDSFSAVSLRKLIEDGYTIGAVITKPDTRKGRGRTMQPSLVKQIALEHNISVLQPIKVVEVTEAIQAITQKDGAKPVGVLVSYGKIIPQAIIDLFEPGIINVHPSRLPQYRGPSPIESAILNGDTNTAVSIMQLTAQMDTGPIYAQIPYTLSGSETTPELENSLAHIGAEQLSTLLPSIIDGSLQPTPQNEEEATYCHLLSKTDGILDLTKITAHQAERQVRAYVAYPKTKTNINGQQIIITKAHVSEDSLTPLDIKCSDGKFLSIEELVGPSGRSMNAKAFLNGYAAG